MDFCRKTILLLIFSSFMSVGWGCIDGEEVELWGVCYNIETTTYLNLWYQGLTGDIPQEIGNLTNLQYLLLEGNQLTGEIPPEIGNLTNLDELWLSQNQLTGEIPSEIGQLTNLTYLGLFSNQLTGEIPPEICNLNYVYVTNNQLCPPYPECLTEEDIGYQDTSECEEPSLCDEEIEVELWGECYNIEETTYLDLSLSGLTGGIPPEIGNLTNLRGLELSSNQLTGEIPREIGNLTNLTDYLSLGFNQLSGEIPPEIGNLTNLTDFLSLHYNQLSGEIPPEIGNLTNLRELGLDNNQLSGEIPSEIGNLYNLELLWLSNNQFGGFIPESICDLSILWDQYNEWGDPNFHIYNNSLCPPYPECIEDYVGYQDTSECEPPPLCDEEIEVELWGECYNIEETTTLILSGLTGEIPSEIGNLTNLVGLVLSSNQFIGEIPPEIGNLTNLTGLFLNNNLLTGRIPSEIGNLTNLTNLDLSDNELTGEIPPEIGNVTNLFQLLLNNNQLMGEIPESICNIDIFWISFPYFDIDNNELCPPYPDCISEEDIGYQDTSECEEPSLCNEGYTEIDGECYYQSDLDVVQDFIDSNESLYGYSPLTLTNTINWLNGHLGSFLLYDRGITTIPESIGNLDSLDMIYFFENDIESVPESIGNLINLRFLDLGRNNITNIPDTIWGLENLTTLNFQENQLTSISDEVCNIYSNLEYGPFLSVNQICPPYPECLTEENIGYQDTSECVLCEDGYVELWGECYTITFTTYLDLSEMGLSGEIPSEIGDLTNLTNLDLGGNQLSGEIPSEICNLNNLTVLDLGGNQLSGEIPSEICNITNLTELELGGNQLSGEIPSCIGNLNNLTFLHLEYNQLSGEIPSEIGNLTNLIWLNIVHNQLSGEIPSSICNLDMSWSNPNNFNIYENQLCPPYPECIEDYVGEQDTSECEDISLCDEEYTEIDGECYYQSDLDVLQDIIDHSQGGNNPPPI